MMDHSLSLMTKSSIQMQAGKRHGGSGKGSVPLQWDWLFKHATCTLSILLSNEAVGTFEINN